MIDWSRTITAEARTAAALEQAKVQARADLSAAVGQARSAYITVMPGQEMIYLAKEDEARRYLADAEPDLAHYPLLAAEVGLTAPDAPTLAALWMEMAGLWRTAAARLEGLRLSASAAISTAETPDDVAAISAQLKADLS